jgi:shikimate dehydrogenase
VTISFAPIQPFLANTLAAADRGRFAGIFGDRPSQYAKSPSLWNAVFGTLKLDALYVPFDVDEPKLGGLVGALRGMPEFLGGNVTVPYKVRIIEYLDDLDTKARQIGAVNTVVRTKDGRLVGYNTDGGGFMQSLTTNLLPKEAPLLPDPRGVDVLMVGAGGAARAVAFFLAEAIGRGRLTIVNRTHTAAVELADAVNRVYGNTTAAHEDTIGKLAAGAGLVVNCSTKGQSGTRKLPGGEATILEPYSALAPANPARLPESLGADFPHRWFEASLADIERNTHAGAEITLGMAPHAVAYDLIYAPLETVFLRQCRLAGHRTADGKAMNIAQAVEAFVDRVCAGFLPEAGLGGAETRGRVVDVMASVW